MANSKYQTLADDVARGVYRDDAAFFLRDLLELTGDIAGSENVRCVYILKGLADGYRAWGESAKVDAAEECLVAIEVRKR
jgi:hypothetical protein